MRLCLVPGPLTGELNAPVSALVSALAATGRAVAVVGITAPGTADSLRAACGGRSAVWGLHDLATGACHPRQALQASTVWPEIEVLVDDDPHLTAIPQAAADRILDDLSAQFDHVVVICAGTAWQNRDCVWFRCADFNLLVTDATETALTSLSTSPPWSAPGVAPFHLWVRTVDEPGAEAAAAVPQHLADSLDLPLFGVLDGDAAVTAPALVAEVRGALGRALESLEPPEQRQQRLRQRLAETLRRDRGEGGTAAPDAGPGDVVTMPSLNRGPAADGTNLSAGTEPADATNPADGAGIHVPDESTVARVAAMLWQVTDERRETADRLASQRQICRDRAAALAAYLARFDPPPSEVAAAADGPGDDLDLVAEATALQVADQEATRLNRQLVQAEQAVMEMARVVEDWLRTLHGTTPAAPRPEGP